MREEREEFVCVCDKRKVLGKVCQCFNCSFLILGRRFEEIDKWKFSPMLILNLGLKRLQMKLALHWKWVRKLPFHATIAMVEASKVFFWFVEKCSGNDVDSKRGNLFVCICARMISDTGENRDDLDSKYDVGVVVFCHYMKAFGRANKTTSTSFIFFETLFVWSAKW